MLSKDFTFVKCLCYVIINCLRRKFMAKQWYKLDNAAKLFPSIFSNADRNGFRIAALFKEEIQELIV